MGVGEDREAIVKCLNRIWENMGEQHATITALRQQVAALARECEEWRANTVIHVNGSASLTPSGLASVNEARAATDALCPNLTTIAGGSNG